MKDLIDELLECTDMQEVSMNARFDSYELYVFNRLSVLEALNRKSFSFERMLMEREIFTESEYGLEVRKGIRFPVRKKDLDYFFVSGQDFKQKEEFIRCIYFDRYHYN